MAWKTVFPWFGAAASLAAGFVWARKAREQRAGSPRLAQTAPLAAELDEVTETELFSIELDLEGMARDDALRALEPSLYARERELDRSEWDVAEPVERDDHLTTADSSEHAHARDEPYDAVDAEDMGTAWLRRATQMDPLEESDPNETLGTHVIETGEPSESSEDLGRDAAADTEWFRSRR